MRKLLNDPKFLITFDTSTPFLMVKNATAFGLPLLRAGLKPTMSVFKPPHRYDPNRLNVRWPIGVSGVGRKITLGDLNVHKGHGNTAQTAFDSLSYALLIHHNLNMLLIGIDAANAATELAWADAKQSVSAEVHTACIALERAACSPDWERVLKEPKHCAALVSISTGANDVECENDR